MAKKSKSKVSKAKSSKKKITKVHLFAIVVILGLGSYGVIEAEPGNIITNLLPDNSSVSTDSYISDQGTINVYFCPREDCENAFLQFISSAENSLHCALYEIDMPSVQQKLLEMERNGKLEVRIVTDDDYLKEFNHSFVKVDSYGLMHNKFCILDGKKISGGSMNPTLNDMTRNNNNLLLIESEVLARNYEEEFAEMWNGTFKKGEKVRQPMLKIGDTLVSNYFCPEDQCAFQVKEELKKAKESIHFMTFSFTNDLIGNMILLKKMDNLTVRGVMDIQQVSKDSQFHVFSNQGIDVLKDGNKYKLHHKVFIIDNETVITGSFNPTGNGDKNNDENVLIIKDKDLARKYLDEWEMVYGEASDFIKD
ncbi:hypothetical protein J4437_02355 [Candidatus Woesearchaeota archaeon]|nr:hypothetical protein [Candidatus Woesearchaeota archaeon]